MRLHATLLGQIDSLLSESQRLHRQVARLDTHTVAGGRQAARLRRLTAALRKVDADMRNWTYDFQQLDTLGLSPHQYDDLWADAQLELHRLEAQMRTALDSARRVR